MIFVNARRVGEKLATAINELAGEEVALAHHGSVAREERQAMEERLKAGTLPCIVATSSLELGIDMGAVELVIQIAAPPGVASGLQRLGRARHQVGGVPSGVLFPKHRGDLLAPPPRPPLAWPRARSKRLFILATRSTFSRNSSSRSRPKARKRSKICTRWFARQLLSPSSRAAPSTGFWKCSPAATRATSSPSLRARITWDRVNSTPRARDGSQQLAVANAGTIPDRGLYGVFLEGADGKSRRVGELDEEMVHETRTGEVFMLGASSWRVEEITHERVVVTPAPGVPGKMPFWRGDGPGRTRASSARGSAKLARELSQGTDQAGLRAAQKRSARSSARRKISSPTSAIRRLRPARFPAIGRSWSSDFSTSWATCASA